ncbi:addiction module antitoxin, RelB/DinJ family [Mycobacterium tuberculosis]|nr:addiction module antitoxin, RelB/DinJ family [Mycobacterium tuberculosis]
MSQETKTYINIRISEDMKKRVARALEWEGIDQSTLILSYVYQFVQMVEAGDRPDPQKLTYAEQDRNRTKFIQVRVNPKLKQRLKQALNETNLSETTLVLSYLVCFVLESEKKHL